MPASRVSFDTNVLLYLLGTDPQKAARAKELLGIGGHISVQLLAEFTNVARRKTSRSWDEIEDILAVIEHVCVVHPLTLAIQRKARTLARAHRLSIYDAQIVAAALEHGAEVLWSEDMQDGRVFEVTLTIRNPFAVTRQ
jgi:predicted nucleic acid-binding protein